MSQRMSKTAFVLLSAAIVVVASSGCPGRGGTKGNIVLVTIESLRSDRLTGPKPMIDPFENLRAAAEHGAIRTVMASSSETVPSLVSLFTGVSPARHKTLVEGLDRLPASLPTLAEILKGAGYKTGGFPSLASLGLSSGVSRGFNAYGWSPLDLVTQGSLANTNKEGWVLEAGRRPGQASVADALTWVRRHRKEPLFLWVHLAEATPPYATDRALIDAYRGSMYDAAMAYEDRSVKALMDGFGEIGLLDTTTFLVAGDHGESLGAHGESFHGLNLYPPALETVVVILPPPGRKVPASLAGARGAGSQASPGRLQDLFAAVLDLAGVPAPPGSTSEGTDGAKAGLPSISTERPLLAVTLGPRSAFGWPGRMGLSDGEWMWIGPENEELFKLGGEPRPAAAADPAEVQRAGALRDRAMKDGGVIAPRLAGRPSSPDPSVRSRVVELLRAAAAARESRSRDGELSALRTAWGLDPGNYEIAVWLALANGPKSPELAGLARDVEERGAGFPETLVALARLIGVAEDGESLETLKRACLLGGEGCAVDLAIKLSRAGKYEDASKTLTPIAEASKDADLWRTLGEIYFAVENTYRAGQAFDKAAALAPDDPDILLRQGDCLAALRDYKGANTKYEAVRTLQPDLALVELRLGSLARQQGDRPAAVEHFRKGIGADPNTAAGAIALGRVLSEQGMTAEAIPLFRDAAARDTSSGDALYYEAEALAAEGKLEDAEKALRSALERSPSNPTTLYTLARLTAFRGDRAAAGALLEQLARSTTTEIAVAALRDPLFTNDAPGAPLAKGLQALYDVVKQSRPKENGSAGVEGSPTGALSPPSRPHKP